jgi:hypothetical protein
MQFVAIEDDKDAVERIVSGFSEIRRISPGLIRETYYLEENGVPRAVLHVVWETQRWIDFQLLRGIALDNIRQEGNAPRPSQGPARLTH